MDPLLLYLRTLGRFFLVGLLAVLPLLVTVLVVMWVYGIVADVLGPEALLGRLLGLLGLPVSENETLAYFVGWLIVLIIILGLGMLVESGARRFMYERVDAFAVRIPVLGTIYATVRQLSGMMDVRHSADLEGMSVVFCSFGKESGASFLCLLPTPHLFRVGDVDCHAVLVPTAPVPIGGGLIFVPASSVRATDMSVDAFVSIYVSMGVSGPQFLPSGECVPSPNPQPDAEMGRPPRDNTS